MKTRSRLFVIVAIFVLCPHGWPEEPTAKSHKISSVSMRKMADCLHAVIAADHQAYAELAEKWYRTNTVHTVPSHAQMLRAASSTIQRSGAEFSYTLRSLWPIDRRHGPQTETEQAGLEAVAKHPAESFYSEETLGGRSYFTAIYSSRATLDSCADCHNKNTNSARHDFKTNDVMGAIIVRIPLEF